MSDMNSDYVKLGIMSDLFSDLSNSGSSLLQSGLFPPVTSLANGPTSNAKTNGNISVSLFQTRNLFFQVLALLEYNTIC